MPPALTDYTYAFGDSGFVLNSDSLGMPFVDVSEVDGLDNAPLRTTTDEHQGSDGTYIDTPYMSSRTIVVTGILYSPPGDPDTLLNLLKQSYGDSTVKPFYFQQPGQPTKFCNGQGGGIRYNVDGGRRSGQTSCQFTVLCEDPYIYDYPGSASAVSVPTLAVLGTSFNMAFNVGFGGAIPNYGANVTNNGNHTAYPIITITGPTVNPVLTDSYSGITMSFSLSLAAGDVLVVDCRQKSVVLNGTVSRRTSLAGLKWLSVPAGISDTIFFTADSGSGSANIQLWNTYW
jgi:hypothetical protein